MKIDPSSFDTNPKDRNMNRSMQALTRHGVAMLGEAANHAVLSAHEVLVQPRVVHEAAPLPHARMRG